MYSVEIPVDKDYLEKRPCFFFSELPGDWWGSKSIIYTALNEAGTVQGDRMHTAAVPLHKNYSHVAIRKAKGSRSREKKVPVFNTKLGHRTR